MRHHADATLQLIASLHTGQFRNLEDSEIRFEDGWSLLVGDNGAGKTSLLEAVYLAATSKSFLTHRLIDCGRSGCNEFSTAVESDNQGRYRLSLAWSREQGLRRTINDSATGLLDYLEVQPVLAYTARDADLLDGAPVSRRRFLDANLVNQEPATIRLLARLRSILESKRAALIAAQPLEPWNELLAPAVIDLQERRRQLISELQLRTVALMPVLGLDERAPRIEYQPSTPHHDRGVDAETLAASLNRRQDEERQCGYPLWGPQRDDWGWRWDDEVEVRRRSSRGERKALTLALFVACCHRLREESRPATLLIDDLDSELDSRRRQQVCTLLTGLPQVIATSSRRSEWHTDSHPATHSVGDGRIRYRA